MVYSLWVPKPFLWHLHIDIADSSHFEREPKNQTQKEHTLVFSIYFALFLFICLFLLIFLLLWNLREKSVRVIIWSKFQVLPPNFLFLIQILNSCFIRYFQTIAQIDFCSMQHYLKYHLVILLSFLHIENINHGT